MVSQYLSKLPPSAPVGSIAVISATGEVSLATPLQRKRYTSLMQTANARKTEGGWEEIVEGQDPRTLNAGR